MPAVSPKQTLSTIKGTSAPGPYRAIFGGDKLSGFSTTPKSPAYYAPATQISRATPALPVASYQSLGLPNYSSGRAIYTSKPSPLLPLPSAVTSQITNVEIRERFNYDPSKKLRGAVGSDGSFIAKSLEGGSVHGSITQSPAGKTEIQVRPSYNWDPSNSYRGELEAGGVVQLKNSITGKSIKGTYEWSSLYGVK